MNMLGKNTNNKLIQKYLLVCFIITYLAWGIVACYSRVKEVNFNKYNWMIILYALGVIAPAVSAIFVQRKIEKKKWKNILSEIIKLPKNKSDWIIVLMMVFITQILPYFIWGGKIAGSFINLIIFIPMFLVIGGLEEIGWRGFWLKKELEKENKNIIIAVLIIGVVWEMWHLPLFAMLGTYQQAHTNIIIHLISTLAMAFTLGGVYIRSRSILLCMLMHSLINSFSDIVMIKSSVIESIVILVISFLFFIIINKQYIKEKNK